MKKILWRLFGRQMRRREHKREVTAAIMARADREYMGMALYALNSKHRQQRNFG